MVVCILGIDLGQEEKYRKRRFRRCFQRPGIGEEKLADFGRHGTAGFRLESLSSNRAEPYFKEIQIGKKDEYALEGFSRMI